MFLTQYRSSASLVMLDLLLQELMPFAKNSLTDVSQTFLCHISIYWIEITFGPFGSAVVGVMPLKKIGGTGRGMYCNIIVKFLGWLSYTLQNRGNSIKCMIHNFPLFIVDTSISYKTILLNPYHLISTILNSDNNMTLWLPRTLLLTSLSVHFGVMWCRNHLNLLTNEYVRYIMTLDHDQYSVIQFTFTNFWMFIFCRTLEK